MGQFPTGERVKNRPAPSDATSKLAYHRARWMDARAGRFEGMDPWPGSILDPATLHRYAYAGGNPVWWVDPTGQVFGGVSTGVSNLCMNVLATMATATPRLFMLTVTGMRAVAQVAQMLNDEFTSGGAVTLNPTSMLSRSGVEIAETVAKVRPKCGFGQCAFGVNELTKKLGELFPGLRTRTVQMAAPRGTFRVTAAAQGRVVGAPTAWEMHVGLEIEGGQVIDPSVGMIFENQGAWKQFVVHLEDFDRVRIW